MRIAAFCIAILLAGRPAFAQSIDTIGGFPAPSGAAGGDLTGTYPNPTIKASVSLTTPVLGVATGTSLALGGCTIGAGALCATGTANVSGTSTLGSGSTDAVTIAGGAAGGTVSTTAGTLTISSGGGATTVINDSGPTLPNITTGTNADVLCIDAGKVIRLQAAASCTISSRRFKYDFGPVREDALNEVLKMKPILFKYKDGDKNPDPNGAALQIGFYAEDMAKVDARLALYEQDMRTVKSYRQDGVLALAIKAIQEQQSEINHLRQRVAQMERHR